MNKVILMGRLTRDPALSYLPSQTAVCEIGIAVSEQRKQQDGSYKDVPCFVDCKCFAKRGEAINKYFKKGDPILLSGKLEFNSWQAQDGSKRSKLTVFIEDWEFVGGKKESGGEPQQQGYNTPPAAPQSEPQAPYDNDDIPF